MTIKPRDTLVGRTVGSYAIRRCLGVGGMGAVYLGEHPEIRSRVAIKVLLRRYVSDPGIVGRFLAEARATNLISHPGIVRIHDCRRDDDVGIYLVMEYLEGDTLLERFKVHGVQPVDEVLRMVRQTASALAVAHERGVVHRDLKPSNIFAVKDPDVPGGERVKVLDFGIAKLMEGSGQLGSGTQTGMVFGSPHYMAPEQCLDAKDVDHRSDIYSLGAIAYLLLGGRLPYEADTFGRLIIKHRQETPPALTDLNPDVSPDVAALVMRTLAVERSERFPDMHTLRAEVTRVELARSTGRAGSLLWSAAEDDATTGQEPDGDLRATLPWGGPAASDPRLDALRQDVLHRLPGAPVLAEAKVLSMRTVDPRHAAGDGAAAARASRSPDALRATLKDGDLAVSDLLPPDEHARTVSDDAPPVFDDEEPVPARGQRHTVSLAEAVVPPPCSPPVLELVVDPDDADPDDADPDDADPGSVDSRGGGRGDPPLEHRITDVVPVGELRLVGPDLPASLALGGTHDEGVLGLSDQEMAALLDEDPDTARIIAGRGRLVLPLAISVVAALALVSAGLVLVQ